MAKHQGDGLVLKLLVRGVGVLVLHHLGVGVRLVIPDGRVKRGGPDGRGAHHGHAGGADPQLLAELLVRWLPSKDLLKLHRHPAHLRDLVHQVDRESDGLRLVGQRTLDRLLDPPGSVGRKLSPLGGVEPLDGLHQADVSLADEVQQRKPEPFIIVGDLDHEAEVRLDHEFPGLLVPFLDLGREVDLLLGGEELHLADLPQVELECRVGIVGGAFLGRRLGRRRRGGLARDVGDVPELHLLGLGGGTSMGFGSSLFGRLPGCRKERSALRFDARLPGFGSSCHTSYLLSLLAFDIGKSGFKLQLGWRRVLGLGVVF